MNNITQLLQDIYLPKKALVLFESIKENEFYIESYDMDEAGKPINAHPLSEEEADELATTLQTRRAHHRPFLYCDGLLPDNLLYIDTNSKGGAIWYTPAQKCQLLFKEELSIPSGKAWVPPLIWKATKRELSIYSLNTSVKPSPKTELYIAPFFNVHQDGRVCMGNVDIEMPENLSIQNFLLNWQQYFFNSYFSHLLNEVAPLEGNIIQIWQHQISTQKKFPLHLLKKQHITVQKLIV